MKSFKFYIINILICLLFSFYGCDWFYNKEEAKKLVLQEDPSFSQILKEKDEIDKDIEKIETLLATSKKIADSKIKNLKRKYSAEKKKLESKIQNLQSQLDKYIDKIEIDIQGLSRKLKSKRRILKNIESMIKETNNLLAKGNETQLTSNEREKWQKKLSDLKLQRKDILDDVESLREILRIEKAKIRLLKS